VQFVGKNFREPILLCIREIRKARKTEHENPEFGHKPDEGEKDLEKVH